MAFGAACGGGDGNGSKPATGEILEIETPKPVTAWDKISAKIRDGKISKEGALEAFALQFDVDIPGVTIPSGDRSDGISASGSLVREWIEEYRDELTDEQIEAIDGATGPREDDVVWTLSADADPVVETGGSGVAGQAMPRAVVSDDFAAAAEATLYEMLGRVAGKLNIPVLERGWPDLSSISETFGQFTNVTLRYSQSSGGNTLMETVVAAYGSGRTSPCNILIYRSAWTGESATNGKLSDRLRVLLAHEVIHCYQNTVNGLNSNAWIDEGTATWGATNLLGIAEPGTASFFGRWLNKPWMQIGQRTYDAVGFWSLAHRNGRDLWGNFIRIWKDDSTAGALQMIGADSADISSLWAPTSFNRSDYSVLWQTIGVGVPSAAGFAQDFSIGAGNGFQDMREGYSAMNYRIADVADEVFVVETAAGTLGMRDARGQEDLNFTRGVYCMVDSCVCPEKTKLAGQDMASDKRRAPLDLAFFGGNEGAVVNGHAFDLEELCGTKKPKDPKRAPTPSGPGECQRRCGGSNGDPHLTTINGVNYDLQAAGEYTLLRDPSGGLTIQARQQPFDHEETGPSTTVAINTALAVQVGSHVISAERIESSVEFKVDGVVTNDPNEIESLLADNTLAVQVDSSSIMIQTVDGVEIYLMTQAPYYGLQVAISASEDVADRAVGLLAEADSKSEFPLPALRGGGEPAGETQELALYDSLAPSWLIDEDESLLPGDRITPDDYPGFPDLSSMTLSEIAAERRAAAEKRCEEITDPELNEQCVFDVLFGAEGFADNYSQVEQLVTEGYDSIADDESRDNDDDSIAEPEAPKPAEAVAGLATVWETVESFVGAASTADGSQVYAAANVTADEFEIVRVDVDKERTEVQVVAPARVLDIDVTDDALWTTEQGADYLNCEAVRRDLQTLEEVARVKIQCGTIATQMLSTGTRVWTETSGTNETGEFQQGIAPIDPETNSIGTSITRPAGLAFSNAARGVILYFDNDGDGAAVLTEGAEQFELIKEFEDGRYLVEDGFWINESNTATKYDFEGKVVETIDVEGTVIAVTPDSVFVTGFDGERDVLVEYRPDSDLEHAPIPQRDENGGSVPLYNDTRIFVSDDAFVAVIPMYGDGGSVVQMMVVKR